MKTITQSQEQSSPNQLIVTIDDSVSIDSIEQAIKMLRGVTSICKAKTKKKIHRLFDPETGEYLNEKTMKAIESAQQGKDIAFEGSVEEFIEWTKTI